MIECNHENTGRYTTYGDTYIDANNYENRTAFEKCSWCRRTMKATPERVRYVAPETQEDWQQRYNQGMP